MKIPNNDLQIKIFGYATSDAPPVGSYKAKVYELLEQGLTDEQIEKLAKVWQRAQNVTQSRIINPIIEERRN
jgi:hypothetical protein